MTIDKMNEKRGLGIDKVFFLDILMVSIKDVLALAIDVMIAEG